MRLGSWMAILATAVAISSCASARGGLMESDPSEERIDHYKVWKVETIAFERPVSLKGQFDAAPWQAHVRSLEYLANPVEKNGQPIRFPDRHLVAYFLRQAKEEGPRRWVTFTNQFGPARWRLTDPALLLLPASKVFEGEPPEPPGGLDHFLCYLVRQTDPVAGPVRLVDQFDRRREAVEQIDQLDPAFFCVPVEKNGRPLVHPEVHLAIYDLDPGMSLDPPISVRTRDQFGMRTLEATHSLLLAVPSTKREWGPDPDGDEPD